VRPLNIGIFHALGDFSQARRTSIHHCKYLQRYQPRHNYLYHDVRDPVTAALRSIELDAVIFDVTFLCYRWARPRSIFDQVKERYRFLAEGESIRLAFPQDEYDHGAVLDRWLDDYRVDLVYSVVWDAWDLIFPLTQRRAKIIRALTGYVDDADLDRAKSFALPFASRPIDVSYRARDLPPQFGRHGQLKAKLGERFQAAAAQRPLVFDVSNRPQDVLLGDDWSKLLGRSKYVLGCEGGSSLWDPEGELQDRVREYLQQHPGAPYEEVEDACFAGQNREPPFSAISPRLFEVAAAGAAQIMVRAPYLGRLVPDRHYLCLEPDLSNADQVLDAMGDQAHAERMIEACYEELVRPATWRYQTHAAEVIAEIERLVEERRFPARSTSAFLAAAERHQAEIRAARLERLPPLGRLTSELRRVLPDPIKEILRPAVPPLRRIWRRLRATIGG
jgi:hypothetical protein